MMVRDRIKKVFASRIFYIIFSILASISIWLYVSYIENPDITNTIRNIKIEVLNQDYVTDKGLVVTAINTDMVTLRFTGKRNIVTKLTKDNITASVDLKAITKKGPITLAYDITYPIDVNPATFTTSKSVDFITITVDSLATKEIPVRSSYDGGVAAGYQAEPIELTPAVIAVSGPQEVLSKIAYAWVPVHRENISKTVEESLPFTLMDDSGHEVVSDKLTLSQDMVNVIIRVVKINDVPLNVNLIYGAGANETNTVWNISPDFIKVSGDAETLNTLNHIPLGTIDTTKFLSTTTVIVPIVLQNDITNVTGVKEATVTVTITGLESMHVTTNNISVTNETPGYSATVITKTLDILLRGTAADINKITPDPNDDGKTDVPVSYRVVADLSELGETTGTYSVLAKVYVDGDVPTVGAIGEYKVTVVITKD